MNECREFPPQPPLSTSIPRYTPLETFDCQTPDGLFRLAIVAACTAATGEPIGEICSTHRTGARRSRLVHKSKHTPVTCPKCNGTGRVGGTQKFEIGYFHPRAEGGRYFSIFCEPAFSIFCCSAFAFILRRQFCFARIAVVISVSETSSRGAISALTKSNALLAATGL